MYVLANILVTARRNLTRNKFYFLFNIFCFSLGISSFLLIYSLYNHESCYDCTNSNYQRVFRVQTKVENGSFNSIGAPLAIVNGLSQLAEVEAFTRISYIRGINIKASSSSEALLDNVAFVDDSYFNILGITGKCNETDKISLNPYEVILSRRMSEKLYGVEKNCDDEIQLIINDSIYLKVVDIIDNPQTDSNFPLEILCSIELLEEVIGKKGLLDDWLPFDDDSQVLVLLNNKDNEQILEERFPDLIDSNIGPGFSQEREHFLVNVGDAYTYGGYHGRKYQGDKLKLLLFTSFCILFICLFNFLNISFLLAKSRLKEIAIRKLYSHRNIDIVFLFFIDCFLVVLGAFLVSIGLIYIFFPNIKQTFQIPFDIAYIFTSSNLILVILSLTFLVLTSTLFLSLNSVRHKIPTLLNSTTIKFGKLNLVTSIVIVQFFISQFLIFASIIIFFQLAFLHNRDLGFNYKDVVVYSIDSSAGKERLEAIRNELSSVNGVESVSFSFDLPYSNDAWVVEAKHVSTDSDINVFLQVVDRNFSKVYNLYLIVGSWIETEADELNNNIVVNEQFIKYMNIPLEEAVGSQINMFEDTYTIKGVVRNFHHQPLYDPIEPLVFISSSNLFKIVSINIASKGNFNEVLDNIEATFYKSYDQYLMGKIFLSDYINQGYFSDKIYFKQILIFSIISLVLNCMSVFSLSSLLLEHKRKEIFIRKTFGATAFDLFKAIYSKFYVYNGYLLIVTIPVSVLVTKSWLSNFIYRTPIEFWFYIIGIFIVLAVYIITIVLHMLKNRLNFQVSHLSKSLGM